MAIDDSNLQPYWQLITRAGDIQILLPVALLAIVLLSKQPATRPLAFWWVGSLAFATLCTTASKIAFLGWGLGVSQLDFTGISGHSMIATSVYPLLMATLASRWSPRGQIIAIAAGVLWALIVGLSRVEIGVHSDSEVLAGIFLGGFVSVFAIAKTRMPQAVAGTSVLAIVMGLWFSFLPLHTASSQTHAWVTRLSLMLSGHTAPHSRKNLVQNRNL